MKDKNKIINQRIKELIDNSGKTRQEIAKDLNCDTSTITKHYNGDRDITTFFLIKYANLFNVSADYILGLSDVKTTDIKLKSVCEFTGLSEDSIKALRNIKKIEYMSFYFRWFNSKISINNVLEYIDKEDITKYKMEDVEKLKVDKKEVEDFEERKNYIVTHILYKIAVFLDQYCKRREECEITYNREFYPLYEILEKTNDKKEKEKVNEQIEMIQEKIENIGNKYKIALFEAQETLKGFFVKYYNDEVYYKNHPEVLEDDFSF